MRAASTTTHSRAKRDFLLSAESPRFCAGALAGFQSLQGRRTARRQFGAFCLWGPNEEQRIGAGNHRLGALTREACEGRFEFSFGAGFHNHKAQPQRQRGGFDPYCARTRLRRRLCASGG